MSRTYAIACRKCRIQLWIGQARYIYTGMPKVVNALTDFLYVHQSHELVFEDNECLAFEDYTEIDVDELPASEATGGYDVPPDKPYIVGEHTTCCVVPRAIAEKIRGKLPESEGQVSSPITSTATGESPARQSGSPEVDPSGECQHNGIDN